MRRIHISEVFSMCLQRNVIHTTLLPQVRLLPNPRGLFAKSDVREEVNLSLYGG